MSFDRRVRLFQQGCRLGLLLIPGGVLGVWIAPGSALVVKSALSLGVLLAALSGGALTLLRCPTCQQRFARVPRALQPAPRIAVRASTCRGCGYRPR